MRPGFSIVRRRAVVAALSCGFAAARAQRPASGIEGRWRADIGPDDNRTTIALEVERDARGGLAAWFHNTLLNFHRVPLPALEPAGDGRWAIEKFGVTMRLDGDGLDITGLLDEPVSLRRAASLPERVPMPVPPRGPAPRWTVRLGGAIFAPVAVRDGIGYVGNSDGVMFAIDLRDGTRAWSFAAGRPIHGEALATDDALYFVCDDGHLYRLDRASGKEAWRYELGDSRVPRVPPNPFVFDYDHRAPRPALADGVLYVGAGDGGFHAVDAASGRRVWRMQAKGKVRSNAAVRGARVVFGTLDNRLYALDRASGREVWSFETTGPVTGSPVFAGEHFIVGDRGSKLMALKPGQSKPLWSQPYWGSWVESSAALHGGEAYIGAGDLFLVSAFDPATGRNRWRTHVGGWVLHRPLVNDKHVVVGVSGARRRAAHFVEQVGAVTVLDRSSGRIVWSWPMPAWPGAFLHGFVPTPAFSGDGGVVIGGVDGSLYAFAIGD